MAAHVGDRLVSEGNRVGAGRRSGTVLDVIGEPGSRRYRVRWDDGHETIFLPGSDTVVEHRHDPAGEGGPVQVVTHVELRFEEDDSHTDARATLRTQAGTFVGSGRARRNPVDPNVPLVGEELAAARALVDLGDRLRQAAGEAMGGGAAPQIHLVG